MVEGNSPQHCLYRFEYDTGVKKILCENKAGCLNDWGPDLQNPGKWVWPPPQPQPVVINRENSYWVSGRCGHCASLKNLRNPIVTGLAHNKLVTKKWVINLW